jgi:hypothetical protein
MFETIKNIFGNSITEGRFQFPKSIPNFIRYGYSVRRLFFGEKSCLMVAPKGKDWNLATLKKQIRLIEEMLHEPVIVQLDKLTALQRTNLIESRIAFVSAKGQIFIPFWGCYFEEKILNPQKVPALLSANAQLVFLYLYYNKNGNKTLTQTQISKTIHLPKATCARAVQQLRDLDLISSASEGTANLIALKSDLNSAFPHLTSPVQKLLFVKSMPLNISFRISGLKALSERSDLVSLSSDGGFAVSRETAITLDKNILIDEQTFRDFGGEIIEVWKYDPLLLTDSEYADDISLLLELSGSEDERVQIELDTIRQKHGLKGE